MTRRHDPTVLYLTREIARREDDLAVCDATIGELKAEVELQKARVVRRTRACQKAADARDVALATIARVEALTAHWERPGPAGRTSEWRAAISLRAALAAPTDAIQAAINRRAQ